MTGRREVASWPVAFVGGLALFLVSLACSGVGGGESAEPLFNPDAPVTEALMPSPVIPSFRVSSPELASLIDGVPRLTLPAVFPVDAPVRDAAMARPVSPSQAERYICTSNVARDCKVNGRERLAFFTAGRFEISPEAVGVVFHGVGEHDTATVLLTYSPDGDLLGGQVVGAEFGDRESGYDGELSADGRQLEVGRYLWVAGEKEFAEDFSFDVRPDGRVDRVIVR